MKNAIAIFAYNRPEKTRQLLNSLFVQNGIKNYSVYIFIDGPKNEFDKKVQSKIKRICKKYPIDIISREENMGLKKNIIDGLNYIAKNYCAFIVLEDDLVLNINFLDYHSKMLSRFENDDRIFSISGFSPYLESVKSGIYLNKRFSSWGWSTWSSKWNKVDFLPKYSRRNILLRLRFLSSLGSDVDRMLLNSLKSLNNSWAIIVTYHLFLYGLYSIAPRYSLVKNFGFDKSATHTKREPQFNIVYDDSRKAYINTFKPVPSRAIFREHRSIYSLFNRLKGKLTR